MENLFEMIVPLVFAAIYFFGNLLSKKEEDAPPPRPRRKPPTEAEAADEARQREIQEAIRRKILERRGGPKAPPGMPRPAAHPARRREPAPEPVAPVPEVPEPVAKAPSSGGFSWDDSANAYQLQMEEQERRIEATRRQAEAIRKQTSGLAPSAYSRKTGSRRSGRHYSGPIRSRLNSPAEARDAIIYAEVLGPPPGLGGRTRIPSDR